MLSVFFCCCLCVFLFLVSPLSSSVCVFVGCSVVVLKYLTGNHRGGGHTSVNTCAFIDTCPESLHVSLWFEELASALCRYRLAVSVGWH